MQTHGVGGYTTRSVGKRWNRRCEELGTIAEINSVAAEYLGAADYNRTVLNRAWKRAIAHQFHDDMPGTSVQRVYRRSWNALALSANQFTSELENAACGVASLMKTDFCEGTPVMVSNPVEADTKAAVTIYLDGIKTPYVRVFDDAGKEVKSQVNAEQNGVKEILFIAEVGSLGDRVYDGRPSDIPCRLE